MSFHCFSFLKDTLLLLLYHLNAPQNPSIRNTCGFQNTFWIFGPFFYMFFHLPMISYLPFWVVISLFFKTQVSKSSGKLLKDSKVIKYLSSMCYQDILYTFSTALSVFLSETLNRFWKPLDTIDLPHDIRTYFTG